jgi:hypothetical protein
MIRTRIRSILVRASPPLAESPDGLCGIFKMAIGEATIV